MEMIVRTIETLDLGLTSEEKMALKKADDILFGIKGILAAKDSYILAFETGEVIDLEGIARARGVISGIADYSQWTFEKN